MAAGLIDVSAEPPFAMPADVSAFDAVGVASAWPTYMKCWTASPSFLPCSSFAAVPSGSNTATLTLGDDAVVNVNLPFTFMWLGRYPVTTIAVTSNGHINIDKSNNPSQSHVCCSATAIDITSTSLPSGISVAHEDLHPGNGGAIKTYYSEADGTFTVSYEGVPFYPAAGSMNAQAVLYPDGNVELRYVALHLLCLELFCVCVRGAKLYFPFETM